MWSRITRKFAARWRSHDTAFNRAITHAYRDAFKSAAARVVNAAGKTARVRFTIRKDYYPFQLDDKSPVVQCAQAAVRDGGAEPTLRISNGGLDANWLVRHGVPTITFGAGQNNVHTTEEYVNLDDYLEGCRLGIRLARQ